MVFDLSLDPAQGRLDRWRYDRICRLRTIAKLTPTDKDIR